ncbi:uncharacterized protein EV422DRAFT_580053 [Fimicolochytrium jonesii]|uniref:uncharacterized protein n=1 Tax=Fimicolochytrium jonesii TaxID=1396493 RepID=UPI0022FE344D|nr:uncharacterized protein EV422DRAFT_580053 [Fimicolochytrium jonesii]KAI8818294.1 hypothetical protein EV422DRAFT_580053 [Fimicolochytrium jonesii]
MSLRHSLARTLTSCRGPGWASTKQYTLPAHLQSVSSPRILPFSRLSQPSYTTTTTPTPTPSTTPPQTPRIHYESSTPFLTLPLSSNPGSQTVFRISPARPLSLLLEQIREEDEGVQSVGVYDLGAEGQGEGGFRWARSTAARHILRTATRHGGFVLSINGHPHKVLVPTADERTAPLMRELDKVMAELGPLAETKRMLDEKAHKTGVRMAWAGLAALCTQFGLMARLTWWEYSWDVMEPISYFLGAGTGILGYMFYVLTSREYTYETLTEVTVTRHQMRGYKRAKFDYDRYLELKGRAEKVREEVARVRAEYVGDEGLEVGHGGVGVQGKEGSAVGVGVGG